MAKGMSESVNTLDLILNIVTQIAYKVGLDFNDINKCIRESRKI